MNRDRSHSTAYAVPGHWNDPDMLVVGVNGANEWMGPGCTPLEYRSHFSLWCLSAAPLLIGCDIRKMDAATKETLLNPELIAVKQVPLGRQGRIVRKEEGTDLWVKPLSDGSVAIGLYNRSSEEKEMTVKWSELGLEAGAGGLARKAAAVRDLWAREESGVHEGRYTRKVSPHELAVVKAAFR
ncbi:hypothetical protein [Cohnella thermotolerans]|uniref:hypothetical protein n=1 Tax=Cohnella thermotolerans TaxID=329858 RepID=UPI00146FBC56|nr:hypothetical protein [Cohnella thermotolerans]